MNIVNNIRKWLFNAERRSLMRWSVGFYLFSTLVLLAVGLLYFVSYSFPGEPVAILYTIFAYTSHFSSIMAIFLLGAVFPLIGLVPSKKTVTALWICIASFVTALVLIDAQLYMAHRFHVTLLTMRIFGWTTWGFGLFYFAMFVVFNSFLAKIVWRRYVAEGKKLHVAITFSALVSMLLFTHGAHIWADAAGYVPITRFTTTLPMFYPSTDKKHMVKWGLADMSNRNRAPTPPGHGSDFRYPANPLEFSSQTYRPLNILLIGIDAMRADMLPSVYAPRCVAFADSPSYFFTNHWSGGNSTKMGLFSLFYGISPTYQQYIESTKRTPVFMDRLLEAGYETGIFTSYKLYRPANLDVTAFGGVKNLRLETKIPGPSRSHRNDSAITGEWKEWLDARDEKRPFFGFLFYDALCDITLPESYEALVPRNEKGSEQEKKLDRYRVSMLRIDSLVGTVLDDLDKRGLADSTIVILTSDHGEEFDDNGLGFTSHGSAFSDYQLRIPLVVRWPGKSGGVFSKRTSHNDITATLMSDALGCKNPLSDFSSGFNLFDRQKQWEWLIVGSYFNTAIVEPSQVTIQFPGGYYEVRGRDYRLLKKPTLSGNMAEALGEMGRFFGR